MPLSNYLPFCSGASSRTPVLMEMPNALRRVVQDSLHRNKQRPNEDVQRSNNNNGQFMCSYCCYVTVLSGKSKLRSEYSAMSDPHVSSEFYPNLVHSPTVSLMARENRHSMLDICAQSSAIITSAEYRS